MELRRIHQDFSVCQVEDYSLVNFESQYCFIGKTDEEKSLVCATGEAPANAVRWIVDWQFQYFENRYNVIVWDAPAHILFCPEAWYTLHIDAPEWGTEMETEKSICHAICKNISYAGGKGSPQGADAGRSRWNYWVADGLQRPANWGCGAEWNAVGRFLSRCSAAQSGPGAHKGQHLRRKAGEHRRAADEGDPLFGKLVDELAKGKAMEKIKRTNKWGKAAYYTPTENVV